MSDTIIKVENISKEYRLGEMGSGTISRDLNAWWAKIKGKENPNLSIEQIRTTKNNTEFHQALSNISFEVNCIYVNHLIRCINLCYVGK